MKEMFNLTLFTSPIKNWNVSNVKNMASMFNFSDRFNHLRGDWDVSKVTDLSMMFYRAELN